MAQMVEKDIEMDEEQGGFRQGTGAVTRVFILWTIICFRLLSLKMATYVVFMDLANFFDTISAALIAVAASTMGVPPPQKNWRDP